jgi:hypothetical protein
LATDQQNSSLLDGIKALIGTVVTFSADDLAKALGLLFAARAAISTVASQVAQIATTAAVQKVQAEHLDIPLTPAVLADMVIRNIVPAPGAPAKGTLMPDIGGNSVEQEAALSGISPDRLKALVEDTGESYGIIDALRLYNRGLSMKALTKVANYVAGGPIYYASGDQAAEYGITEDELKTVIYYSRVRDQFLPDLLKLARNTMSPADAVELAVKQILNMDDARDMFVAAGGVAEQFDALVAGAGDSAGIQHAMELYLHGAISKDKLTEILGLTRINPRFYDLYLPGKGGAIPMAARWLSPYEISEAIKAGQATAEQGLKWMLEAGYDEAQASAFTTAISTGTAGSIKKETEGQVVASYVARMITEQEATTALKALGYTDAAVTFVLESATARRIISAQNTAVARVRAGYLLGELTNDQAVTELSQLAVPQAAIDAYLVDWAIEKRTPHEHLTAAEVGWFVEHGVISADKALAKWVNMGYIPEDAELLLRRYPPTAPPAPAPTIATRGP